MAATTKTVLITGATRGIGLKFAELYIQRGWNVIGAARNLSKAEKLDALSPYKIVQLDTSDEASILRAAKELEGESIDLLINNAGIAFTNDFTTTTKEDLLQQLETNSVGPFLVTRAFVSHLRAAVAKRGAASVAQISSSLGSISLNNGEGDWAGLRYYGYRASKATLNMLNASLAIDLKSDGIAAFTFCPGYVATDMNNHSGVLSADTAVNSLISTIEKLTIADTGKFLNSDGESIPW